MCLLMIEGAVTCIGHPGAAGETHLKTSLFKKKKRFYLFERQINHKPGWGSRGRGTNRIPTECRA